MLVDKDEPVHKDKVSLVVGLLTHLVHEMTLCEYLYTLFLLKSLLVFSYITMAKSHL